MKNLKKLTLLHSNDMHGDFNAQKENETFIGGVSFLSGYIDKVRREEQNVIYAVAGDMFRGSLIDSEFKGVSTIEIMNMLTPDVVTVGNHEVDYGIAHLLFLEKCARFPIINCNMYIKSNGVRLFRSHFIKEIDGMKLMFIGVLTEEVLHTAKKEAHIGTLVDVHDAAKEIGKICDSYRTEDIDFTVLLTHIGFESDKQLARLLKPEWGIDVIIGGHSHTLLTEPCVVNNIPIVQAATGTDQIGRFDIVIDTDKNAIDRYKWQLVPIDESHCPRDEEIEAVIHQYESVTDKKYGRYITKFSDRYTHPCRNRETDVGKIVADALRENLDLDIVLMGSGTIRKEILPQIFTYKDLVEMYPYDDEMMRITLDGAQLKAVIKHIFRSEGYDNPDKVEFYQYSKGFSFVQNTADRTVGDFKFNGEEIADNRLFSVGVQRYHYINIENFMGLTQLDLEKYKSPRMVATSAISVVDEYLSKQKLVKVNEDNRWVTE